VDFIVDLHGLYFTEMRKSVLSITPGIRFKTPGGVVFDFAVDASLLKIEDENFKRLLALDKNLYTYYPDWRFIFVISNVLNVLPKKELPPPPPPPEPEVAKIIGKVYDNSTGEPLIAQVKITYPDTVLISPISTDENGFYTLELKPGTYSIRVEKEGYWWKEKRVILKKGAEVVIDFALKKKTLVFVSGKVLDNITEKPIGAKITIPETKFKGTVSDPETGLYKLKLPPGSYILRVEAEGYLPEEIPIILEEGVPVVKNIKLKKKAKKGVRITLQNIYFDTGKATIKPESYPVLDRVAEFLKANPDAIVEIQGHTDSVGSSSYNMSLSQARANSVKDYLVRYHGIDPRRLIAVGYGETKPIGDNTTREGRAMNRRVEFVIISTGEK
jgi:outer membrane protein OmpA-like peptidoglycan-associated protein